MVRKTQRDFGMDGNRPREVRILKDILPRHQRINRLVNHAFTPASLLGNRSLVLYFEYYSGGDLSRYISVHNRPSELFIWRIFIQLADALALLHYGYDRYARDPDSIPRGWRRVVHRDIKPENVFLRYIPSTHHPTPNVVLGDFGTATLNESTSETGTAEWKGPEIPLSTAKGDVWGLGAIIHALAHGQGPVDPVPPSDWPMGAAARNTWRTSPRARRPRQLSTRYSDALNRNMMQALELDPNKRVSSRVLVQRLAQDLPRRL